MFTDHITPSGRYVRFWRHGSGRRPLMEVAADLGEFEPPFTSGDVPRQVATIGDGIPVFALSEEHYQRSVLQLAGEVLKNGSHDCRAVH